MSHYTSGKILIRDKDCLIGALNEMGHTHLEVHEQPVNLHGYRGDVRAQKAHVVIRRQHVGGAANDIGFLFQDDGSVKVWISENERDYGYPKGWEDKVAVLAGVKAVEKKAAVLRKRCQRLVTTDGRITVRVYR